MLPFETLLSMWRISVSFYKCLHSKYERQIFEAGKNLLTSGLQIDNKYFKRFMN